MSVSRVSRLAWRTSERFLGERVTLQPNKKNDGKVKNRFYMNQLDMGMRVNVEEKILIGAKFYYS